MNIVFVCLRTSKFRQRRLGNRLVGVAIRARFFSQLRNAEGFREAASHQIRQTIPITPPKLPLPTFLLDLRRLLWVWFGVPSLFGVALSYKAAFVTVSTKKIRQKELIRFRSDVTYEPSLPAFPVDFPTGVPLCCTECRGLPHSSNFSALFDQNYISRRIIYEQ